MARNGRCIHNTADQNPKQNNLSQFKPFDSIKQSIAIEIAMGKQGKTAARTT